jgi:hypothetical protein
MRATSDSITVGRSFRRPKIRGIFRFREKPGCPFQARLFALVPSGLALRPPSRPPLADAQEGAAFSNPFVLRAYPQRLARLAPGQRPEQPPLPTVPPCACRARRPWIRADGMSRARERPRLAGAARSPKGEDSGQAGRTLDVTGAERASRRGSRGKVLTPAPRRLAGESEVWGSAPS